LIALSFVLYPLFVTREWTHLSAQPYNLRDAARNPALDALKEIEFDRETGKLSDSDYQSLRGAYMQQAVAEMRAGHLAVCPTCGPRPERDAVFCSNCGAPLRS
jgi:hypothetical protein